MPYDWSIPDVEPALLAGMTWVIDPDPPPAGPTYTPIGLEWIADQVWCDDGGPDA